MIIGDADQDGLALNPRRGWPASPPKGRPRLDLSAQKQADAGHRDVLIPTGPKPSAADEERAGGASSPGSVPPGAGLLVSAMWPFRTSPVRLGMTQLPRTGPPPHERNRPFRRKPTPEAASPCPPRQQNSPWAACGQAAAPAPVASPTARAYARPRLW